MVQVAPLSTQSWDQYPTGYKEAKTNSVMVLKLSCITNDCTKIAFEILKKQLSFLSQDIKVKIHGNA